MFDFVTKQVFSPLVLRFALAAVFIFHGLGKVTPETDYGTNWHPELPMVVQTLVAWGELVGGIAVAAGFLTRLAALGIAAIMAGAIITVHGKNGFSLQDGGYEYNFVLIAVCLAVILLGPGPVAIDKFLFGRKKE